MFQTSSSGRGQLNGRSERATLVTAMLPGFAVFALMCLSDASRDLDQAQPARVRRAAMNRVEIQALQALGDGTSAATADRTAVDRYVDDFPFGDQVIVPGHVPAVTDHLRVRPAVSGEQGGGGSGSRKDSLVKAFQRTLHGGFLIRFANICH